MTLKQAGVFLLSDSRGDIDSGIPGAGLYFEDTRYLSEYRMSLCGQQPDLLDSAADLGSIGIIQFANPLLELDKERQILPHTVGLRRYREINAGMTDQLEVRNYNREPIALSLELAIGADFRDIFDIRGFRARQRGRVLRPEPGPRQVTLSYQSTDGAIMRTLVRFNRTPDEITVVLPDESEAHESHTMIPGHDRLTPHAPVAVPRVNVRFEVQLRPQEHARFECRFDLEPPLVRSPAYVQRPDKTQSAALGRIAEHDLDRFTYLTTNNPLVNGVLDRSLRDIRNLVTPFPSGRIIAAGVPWYVAPFGRDSIITALQTLMFSPQLAVETLRYLALFQGRRVDDWTEEEPGKILHEQRFGEMARLGDVPHVPYYGTVDATPLFIILFCETIAWTGDEQLLAELLPAVQRAVDWIDHFGDSDGDGFVDYGRRSAGGLVNQGWKDSDNSLQFPDGGSIAAPIALVEVQGYVYLARGKLADVLERNGQPEGAASLRRAAEQLRDRFEQRFWSEADEYYGQAIDGTGRLVPAISSNPGHCLYSRIVSQERAERVAIRLASPDLSSGWGIRTLSSDMPHYNPVSYHNGSVWPHDNALIASGLRDYGFSEQAADVAAAVFRSAEHFDYLRLPELYCGFGRDLEQYTVPISYPVSCSPQAWAAGSVPHLLQTMLGLRPDAQAGRLVVQPRLPNWLTEVSVRGLRVAGAEIDLDIRGAGDNYEASCQVRGELEVEIGMSATVSEQRLA